MNGSIVSQLIMKDLRLHRLQISLSVVGGAIALLVLLKGGEVAFVLGSIWFFVSLCILGSMLPVSAIVNERKKQTLTFLMSLPVSSFQYSVAKVVSSSVMFFTPWLILLCAALLVVGTRHIVPAGAIPTVFILSLLPVVGFSLIAGAALAGETEGWSIAASVVCNSSYGIVWYLLCRIPGLTSTWSSRVIVWNATELTILATELGTIALVTALTLFVQSRKRDFV